MLDADTLTPLLLDAMGRVLVHLGEGEGDLAPDLQGRFQRFGRIKGERGRAVVAEALGMNDAELRAFDAAIRDVDRTGGRRDGSAPAERNATIAAVRLLSWFEALGQGVPGLEVDAGVEALVSEDLGRKQVRALELIVRGLITESYDGQEALLGRLREALSEKVVERWQSAADPGDVLSGLTFSELASLFVDKREFERYESIYEDTPFLTLLKQRRRTIQAFLEDVRRVRNRLAHNKKITNTQLTLLDLYYEEIVGPVQTAFDEGDTKVDPTAYLEVTKEDLDGYFSRLQDDVLQVQDDLKDLRASVETKLGVISADTQEIKATTRGLDKKVVWIGAGVLVLIAIGVFLALQGGETQEGVEAARASSARTEAVVADTAETTARIEDKVDESTGKVDEAADKVDEAADKVDEATGKIDETADKVDETAGKVDETADKVDETADKVDAAAARTEEAAARTEGAVEGLTNTTERVAQTLEELRDGFQTLVKQGGIIANATRPQEHYHNARIYERRGDIAQAMQSYREYFTFQDLEFVDPHLRFESFLKLQNGAAGAREAYYDLKRGKKAPVFTFAWDLLLDGEARTKALEAFVEEHPDFAPAWFALSREFSVARLGTQGLEDKRQEKHALERFLALQEEGTFLRFYLDQQVAVEQLEDAKERLAALQNLPADVLDNPVSLSAMHSSIGWSVNLAITDSVKEIFYRLGDEGPFKSTGFIPGQRSYNGLPMVKPSIELPDAAERVVIQIKYTDARDRTHGPYDLVFDPAVQRVQGTRRILQMTRNAWVSFRDYDDKVLLYFSHLMSYRDALDAIRYGLDVEEPDTDYPLGDKSALYLAVPKSTKFVVVQLTFKDGSKSEIMTYKR